MPGTRIILVSFVLYYCIYAQGIVFGSCSYKLDSIWAVEFMDPHDPIKLSLFAEDHNLEYIGSATVENVFLFQAKGSEKRTDRLRSLEREAAERNTHEVVWLEEQKPVVFTKRTLPYHDPLLPSQWHLHNDTCMYLFHCLTNWPAPRSHIHMNVLPAWKMGFTGKGVVIAFIDDGVEHDHPDLSHNWLSGSNNW